MSIPRHFSQRPRRKMAPPHSSMQAHHTEPVVEPEVIPVVEPVVVPVVEAPKWDSSMRKAELLKLAQDLGLQVTEADTKAIILTALDGTLAGQ